MLAPVELAGTFLRERFRKESFVIGIVRPENGEQAELAVKGDDPTGRLRPQQDFLFHGQFEENQKWGKQFKFDSFVAAKPSSREAVIRYLQNGVGIGPKKAGRLWEIFAASAVEKIRESLDEVIAAMPGISIERLRQARDWFKHNESMEKTSIELQGLLQGRGFPRAAVAKALSLWRAEAAERIKRNPFCMMQFRGCGFLRTDAMYLDLGLPADDIKRQILCIWHALASDSDGHTWHPVQKGVTALLQKVSGAEIQPAKALKIGRRSWGRFNDPPILATRRDSVDGLWIAVGKSARHEYWLAELVREAMREKPSWPAIPQEILSDLSPHQAGEVQKALAGQIGILCGGPGTGKTYTLARICRAVEKTHGLGSVAVCCPTGKAAVRCSELLAGYNIVGLMPRTIHSLLRVQQVSEGEGWSFVHGAGNPLPHRFLIVDESSMVGTDLFLSLLSARAVGTGVLLIGDTNQLPPVSHGAPLRDLLAAGLPRGELLEIHRNAGTIPRACAQIRESKPFETDDRFDLDSTPPRNLRLVECDQAETVEKLLRLLRAVREAGRFDPVADVQVVVAVNAKSPLSRKELNGVLQEELNPQGKKLGETKFRFGDKVINLKNGFFRPCERPTVEADGEVDPAAGDVFVANGDIGYATGIDESGKKLTVQFANPRRVVSMLAGKPIAADESESSGTETDAPAGSLDLAYAVTCHKMQGSEAPLVIGVLDEYPGASGPFGICDRSWLYTAVSRGQKACVLLGRRETAEKMCRRQYVGRRKTFLRELVSDVTSACG